MNDQVCMSTRCGVVKNGVIVFTDDNHLTASFSRSVAPVLGARIASALGWTTRDSVRAGGVGRFLPILRVAGHSPGKIIEGRKSP
jgi:hypothetical protein